MQDVNREVDQLKVDIADLERWRDRFYDAIHQGSVVMVRTNNNIYLLQLGCYLVAVVILHVNKHEIGYY